MFGLRWANLGIGFCKIFYAGDKNGQVGAHICQVGAHICQVKAQICQVGPQVGVEIYVYKFLRGTYLFL